MKRRLSCRRGLALAELLTILPVGGLILILAVPVTRQTRMLAQRTDCLTNMQRIGAAMQTYAAEDPAEQAIPIHMNMVQSCQYWEWRTVNWFAWGGDNGQIPFLYAGADGGWLLSNEPNPEYPGAVVRRAYAAEHRPLNGYLVEYPGVCHCPADTGYPDDFRIDDSPRANAGRPCYATLGNSYRANLAGLTSSGQGQAPSTRQFAIGPWGHRLSTLVNTCSVILFADPMFAGMVPDSQPTMYGWHGFAWSDNVAYCDGSARLTSRAGEHTGLERRPTCPDAVSLDAPPTMAPGFLTSGPTWQFDCYPTPGAVIWGNWWVELQYMDDYWPWMNAQQNLGG